MAPSNTVLVVSLVLSLCLIVPLTHATNVRYCAKRDYDVKVKEVKIKPNPVARGKPATFSIYATTGEVISGGNLVIDVSYFGVPVHNENRGLCDETACPVSGDFVISHTQTLPVFTPPGSYTIRMRLHDDKKHELSCIHFDFNIGFASSVTDS